MATREQRARAGTYTRNYRALTALRIAGLAIAATLDTQDAAQKRHFLQIMFLHGASQKVPDTSVQAFALAANWYMALKRWRSQFEHVHWGAKVDALLSQFEWLEIRVADDTITQD